MQFPSQGDSVQSPSRTLQSQSSDLLLPLQQGVVNDNGSGIDNSGPDTLQWSDDVSRALHRNLKPHSIIPLLDGGDFDAEYNSKYKPVEFQTPPGIQKAVLEAVVTGAFHLQLNAPHSAVNKEHVLSYCTTTNQYF